MRKRQKEADDAYEKMWDGGRGSHHPDYDPYAAGEDVVKASRETEELYNAIVKNDIKAGPPAVLQGTVLLRAGWAGPETDSQQLCRWCTGSWRRGQTPTLSLGASTRAGRATRPSWWPAIGA